MSKIMNAADLEFLLYDWLDVESLTARPRFQEHSRATFDDALELAQTLAERNFAPHNTLSDENEPTFDGTSVTVIPEIKQALDAFNETGLMAATMDEEVGGFQLPSTVARACHLWLQAANTGTYAYIGLTIAAANLLRAHASEELASRLVPPMAAGDHFGIMCLSEPAVGSSLGDLTTKAIRQDDGTYRVFGTKMWISGGEHDLSDNIIALVLARTGAPDSGVRGLSLFAVPKYLDEADGTENGERNAITLVGLNHKMGYRGTVNTILEFGDSARTPGGREGAVGHLIGEEGKGLFYMFHMMNEARIFVGAGAAALAVTAHIHAADYARERTQGRTPSQKGGASPMVPIIEHADVRRMLLASKSYAEGSLALVLYATRLLDEEHTAETAAERDDASLLLDVLTPIVKSWPSQWGLEATDLAIQVHGGYGYTREFPVEQFYRDNRLNPIHEGTHGIQGQDLLGRKVVTQDGAGFRLLTSRMHATVERTSANHPVWSQALADRIARLEEVTSAAHADGPDVALANATVYLEAAGHIVLAWIWLDVAAVCDGREDALARGKRAAADYFFEYELPKVDPMLDLLDSRSRTLLDLDPSIL